MNKPVAWMYQIHDITGWTWVITQSLPDYEYRNEKPLYTHPVKELTLTDEEIDEIYGYCFEGFYEDMTFNHIKFARAILRKAQDK